MHTILQNPLYLNGIINFYTMYNNAYVQLHYTLHNIECKNIIWKMVQNVHVRQKCTISYEINITF